LRLLSFLKPSDPQPDLKSRLETMLARLEGLELRFNGMRADWEIVTSHVDQQTAKVHRELGHVTKRKADLEKIENPCDEAPEVRRSRFRGGRSQ